MTYIQEEETIFIPHNVPSSKNSRGISAQGYSFPSKYLQKWWKLTKEDWLEATPIWWKLKTLYYAVPGFDLDNSPVLETDDTSLPILVGFHFVRGSRRIYDWVNPLQTVLDKMVKQGWIIDDSVDFIIPFPIKMNGSYTSYDKENPGVYIKILNQSQ